MTQITIPVASIAQLLASGFTHIELWKSEDLGNSYQPLTAAAAQPPVLISLPASTTYLVGGRSLVLDFSGVLVEFTFEPTFERWTPQQVADRMNQVRPGCASVVDSSVHVSGVLTGRGHFINVLTAPDTIFVVGQGARGVDVFVPLVADQVLYVYTDLGPSNLLDRYRWRFSANGEAPFSGMSVYQKPLPAAANSDNVSLGYAYFVGLDGAPVRGRIIIVEDSPPKVGQVTISSGPMIVEADESGFLQVRLLKGAVIKVAIEGTSVVRTFTVPDVSAFDIMAAVGAATDAFTPATTAPLLTRRSI